MGIYLEIIHDEGDFETTNTVPPGWILLSFGGGTLIQCLKVKTYFYQIGRYCITSCHCKIKTRFILSTFSQLSQKI